MSVEVGVTKQVRVKLGLPPHTLFFCVSLTPICIDHSGGGRGEREDEGGSSGG